MRRVAVVGVVLALLVGGCGDGDGADPTTTTASPATTTTQPAATATKESLPQGFPPELVPPGVTSSQWEPSGSGVEVDFETSASYEEIVGFYTNVLGEPSKVTSDEGGDKTLWISTASFAGQLTVFVKAADPVIIKVSGLF